MTVLRSFQWFLIVGVIVGLAVWGMQYLPANDCQPSRPIYVLAWLIAAVVAYLAARTYAKHVRRPPFPDARSLESAFEPLRTLSA